MRNKWVVSGLLVALSAVAAPAFAASSFSTYVGYADTIRPSPFNPTGLCTGTFWNGTAAGGTGTCGGQVNNMDSGAIDIVNTGTTSLTLSGIDVKENGGGVVYNIWGTLSVVLAPGQNAVFTQTTPYNFDSSDNAFLNNNNSPTNNCSTGALATSTICINNTPVVDLVVDGNVFNLADTGHVIDTGGYDSVNSNPCIGGNNTGSNNGPGTCNESLNWRLIGTTGVQDPGGNSQVPEPATLALLGFGVAGLALSRRRRAG